MKLSNDAIAEFERNGILILPKLFSESEVDRLIDALQPLMRVQQQVGTLTGVHSAGVFRGTSYLPGDKRVDYLSVNAVTNVNTSAEWALARRIADTTFATYPAALELETFSVTLMHGYDIGIASSWSTRTYNGSPGAWRDGSVPHH